MGWRGKIIRTLIVFFAGFATAIYTLAPVSEQNQQENDSESFAYQALKSDQFAQSANIQLHNFVDFAKVQAEKTGQFLKTKLNPKTANQ